MKWKVQIAELSLLFITIPIIIQIQIMCIQFSWKLSEKILSHIKLSTVKNYLTIIIITITHVFPNGNKWLFKHFWDQYKIFYLTIRIIRYYNLRFLVLWNQFTFNINQNRTFILLFIIIIRFDFTWVKK